jgi:hypothetical protein
VILEDPWQRTPESPEEKPAIRLTPLKIIKTVLVLTVKGVGLSRDTESRIIIAEEVTILTEFEVVTPEIVMIEPGASTV